MPTYAYKCKNCKDTIEVFQKVSDAPLTSCPHCEGSLTRQFHPVGIIFKGSGFYTTDYKRNSNSEKKATKKENAKETKAAK